MNGYEFKLTILSINNQVQTTLILHYKPAVELQRVKTQILWLLYSLVRFLRLKYNSLTHNSERYWRI